MQHSCIPNQPADFPADADIRFLRIISLQGPNIWTYRPVLEAWVDIGVLEDWPSHRIPGYAERLAQWLPGLIEHHCSPGVRGGLLQRLHEGTWPAHILEHVTLELQAMAGMPAGFGRAREMDERGVYKVVVRAFHEDVTRRALDLGRELVLAAMRAAPFDVAAAVEELTDLAESFLLGPSTNSIVDAADDRDIPAIRLTRGNLVQLGHGQAQRRIWTAETDRTSAIAETISRDKALTKELLRQCGVPVPEGELAHDTATVWELAQDIGLPVVIKPLSGNHGRAVFVNLMTRKEIETAWAVAAEEDSDVLVERHISGQEHRLLVVGDRMVAAARGEIATVTGDGHSTIRQLIGSQINTDPRRGDTEAHPLNQVHVDSACRIELERQGFIADDIPPAGRKVIVQRIGNVAIDVTDQVHPDTAELVVLAAQVVGLDIAGIDLVADDISRPLHEQRGAIVEVNAGPGLLMHLKPAEGQPRPVGAAIVEHLFPQGRTGRIPIVATAGSGRSGTARLIAGLLQIGRKQIGLASRQGLFLDQRQIEIGDASGWQGMHKLLLNPGVSCAVGETGFHDLLQHGLAFDRCQVAVLTDLHPQEDFSAYAMTTPERRFMIYRTLIDVVLPHGAAVLDAASPETPQLMSLCDGETILFSARHDQEALHQHLHNAGRAVYVQDAAVMLDNAGQSTALLATALLPHTLSLTQALAGIAAVWALGVEPELILAGLTAWNDNQG